MKRKNGEEVLTFPNRRRTFYEIFVKRAIDIFVSGLALIVLSPVLLIISVAIRVRLGRPIFFKQVRIGVNETTFSIIKFRTMRDGRDSNGNFLPDSERLTDFGRFLRSSSLDELPELYNVLKGEMSLVGPRPLPKVYYPYFKQEERLRHSVRGGITGLAQVNGRNAISWDEKFALDVEYVKSISFKTDVRVFFATIGKVVRRSDIGERGVSSPEDLDLLRQYQDWFIESRQGKIDS